MASYRLEENKLLALEFSGQQVGGTAPTPSREWRRKIERQNLL